MGIVIINPYMVTHYMGSVVAMVKNEVLERIVDDFQTKADNYHDMAKTYHKQGLKELTTNCDQKAHAFEYCAMIVRQALD